MTTSSSWAGHRCPNGFVIPDNPTDPRVIWVPNGNGCARACRFPGYFTSYNEDILSYVVSIVPWIGLLLISAVIFSWICDRQRFVQQSLAFIFISLSALFTLSIIITGSFKATTTGTNGLNTFCHDNATEMDQSDGMNVCVAEAGIITFCMLAITFCWTMQSIQLFLNVVWNRGHRNNSVRTDKRRLAINLFVILVLPMGAVVYGGMKGMYGYGRILPICMVAYNKTASDIDYGYLYLPLFFASVIGTVCLVCVVCKIVHRIVSTPSTGVAPIGTVQIPHEGNRNSNSNSHNFLNNINNSTRDLASLLRFGPRNSATGGRIEQETGGGQSGAVNAITPGLSVERLWVYPILTCTY